LRYNQHRHHHRPLSLNSPKPPVPSTPTPSPPWTRRKVLASLGLVIVGSTMSITIFAQSRSTIVNQKTSAVFPRASKKASPPSLRTASPSPSPVGSPAINPSPSPSPSSSPSPEETLPPGAYKAKVIWSGLEGLSLRSEPSRSSKRAGEVAYFEEVVVLEESADGKWVKIRAGGQEGWVRDVDFLRR
jgi:uncharacterized protein YgiM (DUF1202 family)